MLMLREWLVFWIKGRDDLFSWMPGNGLDILTMFHKNAHTVKIRIWMNCTDDQTSV